MCVAVFAIIIARSRWTASLQCVITKVSLAHTHRAAFSYSFGSTIGTSPFHLTWLIEYLSMPILQQVLQYLPPPTLGSIERSQCEWQFLSGVMQTFMAVIAGGTVYQETTPQGTTHVMVMETSCAGLAGQTRLQTALHVRNIPGTFSAFFFMCVVGDLIHHKVWSSTQQFYLLLQSWSLQKWILWMSVEV